MNALVPKQKTKDAELKSKDATAVYACTPL
jgi:hypothetical protein